MERLPRLSEHGLLPEGAHDGSLDELEELLAAPDRSERRRRLFANLRTYLSELKLAGWAAQVILDGSFVMNAVDDPEDIDLILVLPADWDMASEVRPFEYNLLSRRRTRRLYGFDVFAVRAGSPEERTWVQFFQQVNVKWSARFGLPADARKGLLRVSP